MKTILGDTIKEMFLRNQKSIFDSRKWEFSHISTNKIREYNRYRISSIYRRLYIKDKTIVVYFTNHCDIFKIRYA